MSEIIYLDNAATTFPKPESVIMSTVDCMEGYCGNPGRGSHHLAMKSAEKVFEARESLSSLFGAEPENVIFTLNTTYALNMAIKGVTSSGGHVLISNMEHNSVLRPVDRLAREGKISYDVFKLIDNGRALSEKEIIADIYSRLRPNTKLIVCIHSSNICSYVAPIAAIGALCKRLGITFAVDAAQSAGHVPINMIKDGIDLLCLPSHKGLYAPQGCGILITNGQRINTLIEGGNGVNSLDMTMGNASPERYEGGTLCTPAIVGLCAGIEMITKIGIDSIREHEIALYRAARDELLSTDGVTVYTPECEGSVLLFNVGSLPSDEVGNILSEKGFCLRSGYHCSALGHRSLKTGAGGGVRMSFGLFNTLEHVEKLTREVRSIARSLR